MIADAEPFFTLPSLKELTAYGAVLYAVVLIVRNVPKWIDRYMGQVSAREIRAYEAQNRMLDALQTQHRETIGAGNERTARTLEAFAVESARDREACDRRSAEMTATLCAKIAEATRPTH